MNAWQPVHKMRALPFISAKCCSANHHPLVAIMEMLVLSAFAAHFISAKRSLSVQVAVLSETLGC